MDTKKTQPLPAIPEDELKGLIKWLSRAPTRYGNHSCNACAVNGDCPVKAFMEDATAPNSCSFYWPPNADKEPGEWYWKQLNLIAEQATESRAKATLERD